MCVCARVHVAAHVYVCRTVDVHVCVYVRAYVCVRACVGLSNCCQLAKKPGRLLIKCNRDGETYAERDRERERER